MSQVWSHLIGIESVITWPCPPWLIDVHDRNPRLEGSWRSEFNPEGFLSFLSRSVDQAIDTPANNLGEFSIYLRLDQRLLIAKLDQ